MLKTTNGGSSGTTSPAGPKADPTKLVSLLALATGAAAIPQTSNADIIVTDLSSNPGHVAYPPGNIFLLNTLPGTARMGFQATHLGVTSMTSTRFVLAGQAGGYVRVKTNASFVVHVGPGLAWNQIGGVASAAGTMGKAKYLFHTPNGYDHEYIAFQFRDTTQASALRYGWVEVSLENADLSDPGSLGPQATIWRYAFDTTGAQLPTGAVPEPSSMTLLALGALTLGAKGLRSWRRNRTVDDPS